VVGGVRTAWTHRITQLTKHAHKVGERGAVRENGRGGRCCWCANVLSVSIRWRGHQHGTCVQRLLGTGVVGTRGGSEGKGHALDDCPLPPSLTHTHTYIDVSTCVCSRSGAAQHVVQQLVLAFLTQSCVPRTHAPTHPNTTCAWKSAGVRPAQPSPLASHSRARTPHISPQPHRAMRGSGGQHDQLKYANTSGHTNADTVCPHPHPNPPHGATPRTSHSPKWVCKVRAHAVPQTFKQTPVRFQFSTLSAKRGATSTLCSVWCCRFLANYELVDLALSRRRRQHVFALPTLESAVGH
jgi:hypothetical protein